MAEKAEQNPEKSTPQIKEPTKFHYTLHITNKKQLHSSYMPFVKNGGLFIPTQSNHQMEETLDIKVKLMEETTEHWIHGKIIWVNPFAAQGGLPQGVGIQFLNKEARLVRDKIEKLLAGYAGMQGTTDTM